MSLTRPFEKKTRWSASHRLYTSWQTTSLRLQQLASSLAREGGLTIRAFDSYSQIFQHS